MRFIIPAFLIAGCGSTGMAEDAEDLALRAADLERDGDGLPKHDLLFVIHDGSTMADEQTRLGAAARDLADALAGVDARVYVITTSSPELLARFTTTERDFNDAWARAVAVGIDRAALGQGLRSALAAVTDDAAPYRDDAFLSIVHVSDEPDESPGDPERYASEIEGDQPRTTALNALVGLRDAPCREAEVGDGYLEAAAASGGSAFDVCATDYGPALRRLVALFTP